VPQIELLKTEAVYVWQLVKKRNAVEQALNRFVYLIHTKMNTGNSEQQQDTFTSPGIQLLSQIQTRPTVNLMCKSKDVPANAMNAWRGRKGMAPLILNPGTL